MKGRHSPQKDSAIAKTAANTSDTTKSEPKSNYIRIFLFFALFISAVVLAFIYSDNGNFLTGNIVSSETPFENVIVGRNILDGERIDINKEVSSIRISGSFSGKGYAKVYAVSGETKVLVYEFKEEDTSSPAATGFVVYGEEEISLVETGETSAVPNVELTENTSENVEQIVEQPQEEITAIEQTGEQPVEQIIEEYNAPETETISENILSLEEANNTNETNETFIEEQAEQIQSDLQVELPPLIYSEENSTEGNESYNLSEPQIQTGENVSYNESNISADINVAVEITGETGEELSSPENAEDINQSENETEPVEVLPEVLSEKISVEDGCVETCSVFPFNAEYLLFEISDGSLFIDNFSFVLPESGFYLKDNFTFVNITVGEYENINLNDYFSGSGIFFDFTSSEGYSYEISESSLKIIGLNEGTWMGKVYAVKDDVIIESNEFEIYVYPILSINLSTLMQENNLTENVSVPTAENESPVNISDLINASGEEEPLSFIVDENILKIISENSTDSRVRVIVKYKKESAPTSVKEYVDDVKDSSAKLLAEKDVDTLIEEKERKYSELENLIVEKNSAFVDEEEISLNNIDDSALPSDLPAEEAVSSSEKQITMEDAPAEETNKEINEGTNEEINEEDIINELVSLNAKIKEAEFAEKVMSADEIKIEKSLLDAGIESVVMDVKDIEILKNNKDIAALYIDNPVSLLIEDSKEITRIEEAKQFALDNLSLEINGSGIKVCVVDTGINSVVFNYSYGFDFVNNDSLPEDDNGHGTSVGYALKSISPGAEIIAVKVMNSSGMGYESDIIAGLDYCLDENADIVSLSLGGGEYEGYCDDNPVAQKVDELSNEGIVVFAATGNDGYTSMIKSPACARSAIRVGASTKQDTLWSGTNYNNATLLLAPGAEINTVDLNGQPVLLSGTSMSTPIVSGIASLVMGTESFSPKEIYDRLVHTGVLINTSEREFARVDAFNAVINNITNNLSEGEVGINETNGTYIILAAINLTIESPPTPSNGSSVPGAPVILANISSSLNSVAWVDVDRSVLGYYAMDFYNSTGIHDNSTWRSFANFSGTLDSSDVSAGRINYSFNFDGSTAYASISPNVFNTAEDMTVSVWIYPHAIASDYLRILQKGDASGATRGFGIVQEASGVTGFYQPVYGSSEYGTTTDITLSNNAWHHIVMTFDYDTNELKMYINGTDHSGSSSTGWSVGTGNTFAIGRRAGDALNYFDGLIDEVIIFNRTLDEGEVRALYDAKANKLNATLFELATGNHNYTIYAVDSYGSRNSSVTRTFTSLASPLYDCDQSLTTGYYTLATDVTSTDTCFETTTDDVWLDCAGHQITFSTSAPTASYGVVVENDNASISNCKILDGAMGSVGDWNVGIVFGGGSSNSSMNNIYSYGNYPVIYVEGIGNNATNSVAIADSGTAFYVVRCKYCNIDKNLGNSSGGPGIYGISVNNTNFTNNIGHSTVASEGFVMEEYNNWNRYINNTGISDGTHGFRCVDCFYSEFRNNNGTSLSGTWYSGFTIYNSSYNVLVNNSGAGYNGISLDTYSRNNTCTNNTGISNVDTEGVGTYVYNSANNTFIRQNTSSTTSTSNAITIQGSSNTLFKDCLYISGVDADIWLTGSSTNVTMLNCTYSLGKIAVDSGSQLIRKWYYIAYVNDTATLPISSANISAGNRTGTLQFTTLTNSTGWIASQELIESVNNSGTAYLASNYSINATLSNGSRIAHTFNITVLGNIRDNFTFNATGALLSACANLTTANAYYTLSANITSTKTCINISAQNVTINCNNYWINYSSANGADPIAYGIYSNQDGTVISNCNIYDKNRSASYDSRYGIELSDADNSILTNNFVNTTSGSAIHLGNSDYCVLTNNTGVSNYSQGIRLEGSTSNNLTGNKGLSETNEGTGITGSSNYNIFINHTGICRVGSSPYAGVFVYNSQSNSFTNLNASSSIYGIIFNGASNNNFTDCVYVNGTVYNVYVMYESGSTNNILLNCTYANESINGVSNYLVRKWYLTVNVTSSGTGVNGADVTVYNVSSSSVYNELTDEYGQTTKTALTDYVNYNGTATYSTPYNVSVTGDGLNSNSSSYNLTALRNLLANITLYYNSTAPRITIESPPTPASGAIVSPQLQSIVANISSPSDRNTSSWMDYDRTLVGYFAMDSYNSSGIYDNSTWNLFANFSGGISASNLSAGIRGNALNFDGSAYYLVSPLSKSHFSSNITISLFIKPTGAQSTTGIFQLAGATTDSTPWILFQRYSSTQTRWYLNAGYQITQTVNDDNYTHIALTYDGSVWRAYKNGVADGTYTGSIGSNAGERLILGNGYNGYYRGAIDEVLFFNRTLFPDEIKALYDSRVNKFNGTVRYILPGTHNYTIYSVDTQGERSNTSVRTFNAGYSLSGCNDNLNIPNRIYFLNTSVTDVDSCFEIWESNITIDCNNYSVTYGTSASSAGNYGVYFGETGNYVNSSVRNCIIYYGSSYDDWNPAIDLLQDNASLINNTIYSSVSIGVWVISKYSLIANNTVLSNGDYGFGIESLNYSRFINNSGTSEEAVSDNPGIYFMNSYWNNISNSTGIGENGAGFEMYHSSYNNLQDIKGISDTAAGIEMWENNYNNTFRNVNATSTSYYGLYINYGSRDNTFYNTTVYSGSNTGLFLFRDARNNSFYNLTARTDGSSTVAIQFYGSGNMTFKDCAAIAPNYEYSVYMDNSGSAYGSVTNNTFTNCTFTGSEVLDSSTQLIRKWYYDAYTNDTLGLYVPSVNVTGANRTGTRQFSVLSNGSGWIARQEIIDYVNNGGSKYYASNYSVNGSYGSAVIAKSHNITVENNVLDVFTFNTSSFCRTLSAPNIVYNLTQNVSTTSTCFTVTASNVTIDCKGFSIKGNNNSGSIGVYSNVPYTAVVNCTILNFSTGIYFNSSANNGLINNVTINQTYATSCSDSTGVCAAMFGKGSANLSITKLYADKTLSMAENASNLLITFSNIYDISIYPGISYAMLNVSIINTTVTYINPFRANNSYMSSVNISYIYLESMSNLTMTNIRLTGEFETDNANNLYIYNSTLNQTGTTSSSYAIYAYNGDNISIADSNITSASYGITTYGPSLSLRNVSLISKNTSLDVYAACGSSSRNISVSNNYFSSNASNVIYLQNCVANSTFVNNTFVSGTGTGVLLNISLNSGNNTFYRNNFTQTSGYYIFNGNNTNRFNTSVGTVAQGNYYYDISTKNIFDTNSDGWGDSGSDYPLNTSTWPTKWMGNGTDYGPAVTAVSCSVLSAAGTTYNLSSNATSSGTCFNVTAANITIDCKGYTITGNNATGTFGVYSNSYNTTVKNCIIRNFSTGIYYLGVINGTIFNNSISTEHTESGDNGKGIYIYASSNYNKIIDTNANATPYGAGVYISYSSNNTIINTTGVSNSTWGIYLIYSPNNTISNSRGISNETGIYVCVGSDYNIIKYSNGTSTGGYMGIRIDSSYASLISVIGTSVSGTGVMLGSSIHNNTLWNSSGTATSGHGLGVYSNNHSIINFNATSSGNYGIYVTGAYNIITAARAISSGSVGILFQGGINNRVLNSTLQSSTSSGIFLWTGSNNNTILYSNVSGSTVSGSGGLVIGTNSYNNTIANSTINGLAGLYAVLISGTCSGNVFINNTFKNATSTLLDIDLTSGNNRFYWNNFTNASGYYVNNRNNTNTFNTTVTGVAQGNYYDDISTKNVFDSNSNGWGDTGADYPINVSTWATKWTGNGTDYGPATTRTLFVTVTYQSPTPPDNSRQISNSVTINVSVSAGMNVSNCTLQWNGTTNYSMTKVGTGISVYCYRTMATVDGGVYTYKVYANDSLGTLDNSSTRNFTENTKPSVTATITPVSPTTLDNLTCTVGGWTDPQDAPGNYTFQWYNGTTLKFSSGLTTSTTYTLLSTNLSIGDTWNCTITPWDGFENGTAVSTNKYINMPCMTLSTANTIYNMTSNLSSTGTCFTITARNVTLDCRWNWINYSTGGSGSTYAVYSTQNYTTIKNCKIIDGNWGTGLNTRHGIYLYGSNYSYLLNNFINTSNGSAIYVYSSSNYNNITNNTGLSYSTYAINIRSSSNNVLVSNNGTSTINMGLAVWSTSNNNYLYNNTGVGLGGSGGLYIGVSSNNTLISNRGICTDYIGIIIEDDSNCFLDSNIGISQAGSNRGLYVGRSVNITVVNQTATGSRGIQLTSANNTIIRDCVSINGTTYDVHVDATSLNNSFINCSYNTTEEYVESGSQLIRKWYFDALVTNLTNSPLVNSNLTIYNRTSSAVYSNLTNSTGHIYRAEVIDYTNVGGTKVYQTNHTVNVTKLGYYPNSTTYNVTNYTNIFATIKLNKNPLELIDCWTLSATGETYNLSMNVNSSGTCFTVTGQNIVLDCLGYSINYSTGGAAFTYGVYSNQYNTTIRNCTIIDGNTTSSNNNRYGIIFEGNDFSVIYNNFINTSNSDAMWIYSGANYNNISRNRVYSSSGSGIVLHSSLSNKLIDNNATSASGTGIYFVSYSNNNTLLRNFANTTGSNPAIYIYSSSYNNLTQNKGVSTSSNGINIDEHSDNNTLYSNNGTSLGTESAITLSNSVNNSLINNSGNNFAGGIGFLVAYAANNNTLINNTGTSTSGQGVYLFLSYGNNFINQTATGAHGIYVQTSNNTVFRDCGNIAGNSGQDVYYNSAAGSVNNTFINCSYTLSDETVQGSANQLIKKWYYQAYANYTNNTAVPNANITGANRTGSIQFSVLTNSTGWITRQEIIDYVNIGGTRTYYSNYSINGTKSSNAVNHSLNISTLTNMIDNFTFPANSAPSKVTLIYPGDGNGSFIERTPTFSWNAATDPDGNPITYILNVSNSSSFATSTYIKTGISSTSQLYDAGELPFVTGYTPYYWKVRATDGTLEGEWSDTWNFTLVTSVNIVLLVDNVTFPAMNPNVSNSTNATGGPTPLLLKSTSNTYVKISQMNVSGSLWSTQSLNTSYWQMRVTPKSDGSFNSSSLTSYFNVTNVTNLIRYMNYSATRNNASIDINVTVPLYEPPGQKSSSIVFLAQVDT